MKFRQYKPRKALPTRVRVDLKIGHDTAAQAAENYSRIMGYIDDLKTRGFALPADPTRPGRLSLDQVAAEAGVARSVVNSGSRLRDLLDVAAEDLGLSPVLPRLEELTIVDVRARLLARTHADFESRAYARHVSENVVGIVISLIEQRARLQPLDVAIAELQREHDQGELSTDDKTKRVLDHLTEWSKEPMLVDLDELDFESLLEFAFNRIGWPRTRIATYVGLRPNQFSKWLSVGQSPSRAHHDALRKLAELAELPRETFVERIRPKSARGTRLPLADFPEQFRARGQGPFRKLVIASLPDHTFSVDAKTRRQIVSATCAAIEEARKINLRRKKMRDINTNPDPLNYRATAELEDVGEFYRKNHRTERTIASYLGFLKMFLQFISSDKAPANLRIAHDAVGLHHLACTALWDEYLCQREQIGKEVMGRSKGLTRSSVDRIKVVISLLDPRSQYFANRPDSRERALQLDRSHFLSNVRMDQLVSFLNDCVSDLRYLRDKFSRSAAAAMKSKHEVPELVSLARPYDAVVSILEFQKMASDKLEVGSLAWAIAKRRLLMLHIIGQTALRLSMMPKLTVLLNNQGMLRYDENQQPLLVIPQDYFKNQNMQTEKGAFFRRNLFDSDGFHADLETYLQTARPVLLRGSSSEFLLVSSVAPKNAMHEGSIATEVRNISRAAIGSEAPPDKRLLRQRTELRPHHFRDILASSVYRETGSYAHAADALNITESTCREHYAFDCPEMRRDELENALRGIFIDLP